MSTLRKIGSPSQEKEKASKNNLADLAPSGDAAVNIGLTNQSDSPLLVCQINFKRAIIPEVKEREEEMKELVI